MQENKSFMSSTEFTLVVKVAVADNLVSTNLKLVLSCNEICTFGDIRAKIFFELE